MDYFKYAISTDPANNEILIALMSDLPFDTFMETETGFDAFLPCDQENPTLEETLAGLRQSFDFVFEKTFIPGENWNEVWESNFHPVVVDDFCGIRADFHPPLSGVVHELVITPKMAFGTGHHETTYLVIKTMQDLDFKGRTVLDYGCGTGILAILAAKLGAKTVDAIDIEEASWQSTLENSETNGVGNVNAYQGTLPLVAANIYGIVLANINRNVILDSLGTLSRMVEKDGTIVFSGILKTDEEVLFAALQENRFVVRQVLEKNNWLAVLCQPL